MYIYLSIYLYIYMDYTNIFTPCCNHCECALYVSCEYIFCLLSSVYLLPFIFYVFYIPSLSFSLYIPFSLSRSTLHLSSALLLLYTFCLSSSVHLLPYILYLSSVFCIPSAFDFSQNSRRPRSAGIVKSVW
jgi:hypothetical protein